MVFRVVSLQLLTRLVMTSNSSIQVAGASEGTEEEHDLLIKYPLEMSSDRDEKKKSSLLRNYNSRRRLLVVVTGLFLALLLVLTWSGSGSNSK